MKSSGRAPWLTNNFNGKLTVDLLSKTTVRGIIKAMPPQYFAACVRDAIAWDVKGELPDGALRALAARMEAEAGIDKMSSLAQAESAVLREAAIRFNAQFTGLRADQL